MTAFADLSSSARKELWALLALRNAHGVGPRHAKNLIRAYGSALDAVEAGLRGSSAWADGRLTSPDTARRFAAEEWRASARKEWDAINSRGLTFISWADEAYPDLLRELPDPPLLLYYKGDDFLLHAPAVGIVGSRRCTLEGIRDAAYFGRDLSRAGVAVVSGMARGIDRAAHLAGLEGPGRSIGVLGTGIDVVYPSCNRDLYACLAEKGLLISEFPPGAQPLAGHFPIRNRLISGLSQGILVAQAAARSGSLITARLALEQNRSVFVVPGRVQEPEYAGCQEFIRKGGALPVFHADDILSDLGELLHLDALKALERRRAASARRGLGESVVREPSAQERAIALDQPTRDGLPWLAPDEPETEPGASRSVRIRTSAPARRRAGGKAAGEAKGAKNTRLAEALPAAREIRPAPAAVPAPALTQDERLVLDSLSTGDLHIDSLVRSLSMDVAKLSGLLVLLEVRGLVRRAPGMYYSLPGGGA